MLMLKILFTLLGVLVLQTNAVLALDAFPPDYQKKRVLISTDIGGGDKDDTQSMIHFLAYANMFDLEGIVISRPRGHVQEMLRVVEAYEKDYEKFQAASEDYPTPARLRAITKVGARRMASRIEERIFRTPARGYTTSTSGSRWIVKMARKADTRPLHIVAWGSATDIAQALHDAPDIKRKIRVHLGGTGRYAYNYVFDPAPLDYLRRLKKLRMIDGTYGKGVYAPGQNSTQKYGNIGFVKQVIKPRGFLGQLFYTISERIDVNRYGLKMGDSGMVFFLMNGSYEEPFQPSWGGQYCQSTGDPDHFVACQQPALRYAGEAGARSVAIHQRDFLKDWERRLKLIYDSSPS
jgi:hypothetical protein